MFTAVLVFKFTIFKKAVKMSSEVVAASAVLSRLAMYL
jgi:hypothetical protein